MGHDDGADLAGADEFGGFVPFLIGAALGADLQDFAGGLDGVVNLEGLAEVASHRLLDIHMLAGLEGGDGNLGVPVIDGGAVDGVDVFAFENLAVIFVGFGLIEAAGGDDFAGESDAVFGDVADGDGDDVVFLTVFNHVADMGVGALTADADMGDGEAAVGAGDVHRGRLILTVNRGLEEVHSGNGSGGGGGLFQEAAPVIGGRGWGSG